MTPTPASPPAERTIRTRRLAMLAVAALAVVAACGPIDASPTVDVGTEPGVCDTAGVGADTDIYALDEPGTFSALALVGTAVEGARRESVPVEVLALDGRLISSTASYEASTPSVVDLVTGIQFGVAPPPVFETTGGARIRVTHGGLDYELVLVRNAAGANSATSQPVQAPLGPPAPAETAHCRDRGEGVRPIQLDAVHADPAGRQVFLIAPPKPARPVTTPDTSGLRASPSTDRAQLGTRTPNTDEHRSNS